MRRCVVMVVVGALLAALPACGGGSSGPSGPTYSNATWAGDYIVICLSGSQGNSLTRSVYGTLTADGAGMATGTTAENTNGTPGSPSSPGPTAYSVAADGTVTFEGLTGAITPDGEFLVMADMNDMGDPLFCILMRIQGAYTNASLTGNYYLGGMETLTGLTTTRWSNTTDGPVMFDGVGLGLYPTVTQNSGGTVAPAGGGDSGYVINADGTATFGGTWFGDGQGGLSSDGNVAILGGGVAAGEPFFQCLLKQGAGMTNASLAGTFAIVGLESDPSDSNNYTGYFGTMTADGAGVLAFPTINSNEEGSVGAGAGGTTAYTVSATGHLSTTGLEGAIAPDGRVGYLIGSTTGGDSPLILFFVRR